MKAIKGLMIFLVSLAVFAGTVPQAKLDLVNAYIQTLAKQYNDDVVIKIVSANRNDKTNDLDQIAVTADFNKYGKAGLELALAGSDVVLNANYKIIDTDGEFINPDNVARFTESLLEYIKEFNDKGIYEATLNMSSNSKVTNYELTLLPVSEEAVSIKKVVFNIVLPKEIGKEAMIDIKGNFIAKANLVTIAQEGLTGIFTSLSNSEEPKESDFEKVAAVIQAILASAVY